jgi:hypothetical protein
MVRLITHAFFRYADASVFCVGAALVSRGPAYLLHAPGLHRGILLVTQFSSLTWINDRTRQIVGRCGSRTPVGRVSAMLPRAAVPGRASDRGMRIRWTGLQRRLLWLRTIARRFQQA